MCVAHYGQFELESDTGGLEPETTRAPFVFVNPHLKLPLTDLRLVHPFPPDSGLANIQMSPGHAGEIIFI